VEKEIKKMMKGRDLLGYKFNRRRSPLLYKKLYYSITYHQVMNHVMDMNSICYSFVVSFTNLTISPTTQPWKKLDYINTFGLTVKYMLDMMTRKCGMRFEAN
jgi:hypothetical protein